MYIYAQPYVLACSALWSQPGGPGLSDAPAALTARRRSEYIYIYIYTYVYTYVCMCMYIYIYIYIYVCM